MPLVFLPGPARPAVDAEDVKGENRQRARRTEQGWVAEKVFDTVEAGLAHAHHQGYSVFRNSSGARILKCTQHGAAGATEGDQSGCFGGFGSRMRLKGEGGKVC